MKHHGFKIILSRLLSIEKDYMYLFLYLRKPCSDIVRGGVAGVAGRRSGRGSGTEEEWN